MMICAVGGWLFGCGVWSVEGFFERSWDSGCVGTTLILQTMLMPSEFEYHLLTGSFHRNSRGFINKPLMPHSKDQS